MLRRWHAGAVPHHERLARHSGGRYEPTCQWHGTQEENMHHLVTCSRFPHDALHKLQRAWQGDLPSCFYEVGLFPIGISSTEEMIGKIVAAQNEIARNMHLRDKLLAPSTCGTRGEAHHA